MNILNWIIGNKLSAGLIALAISLFIAVGIQQYRVDYWQGQFEAQQKKTNEKQLEVDRLEYAVDEQNGAIDRLNTTLNEKNILVEQLIERQKSMSTYYENKINDILSEPSPETCEESIVYLKAGAGEIKWPE